MAEEAASMGPLQNQHFHRPEATASPMQIQSGNEIHGPQLNAAASTGSWQNQFRPLNPQGKAENQKGFHNELYQAVHINDRVMQRNHRLPHDVKRNSSHGKKVWRPAYGNNRF